MQFEIEPRFKKDYQKLDKTIQEKFTEKLKDFAQNPSHPSFRTKPMKGFENIWEAHITLKYVFTFEWDTSLPIEERTVFLRRIGKHEIYENP